MAQNKKEQQNKKEPQNKKEVQNQKPSQAPQGRKKFKMDLHTRNSLKGLVFVSPFILGVLMFFIYPIFFSIRLSVSTDIKVVGFVVDKEFLPLFGQTIKDTLVNFPLTVVLSLIIAVLLNRDIKCRGLFRVIFFIPFLLGSGEVMTQLINQGVDRSVLNIMDGRLIPYNVLMYFGTTITDAVQMVLGVLVTVLWGCGVQILLFLSGLQSISPSLYEAAKIDGATEWELFSGELLCQWFQRTPDLHQYKRTSGLHVWRRPGLDLFLGYRPVGSDRIWSDAETHSYQ